VDINNLKLETVSKSKGCAVFSIGPLPEGFGHTLGNSLRRVLLTSLEGSAVTQVKIDGATHQFTTLKGVKEDVVEICLNLKTLRFVNHSETPVVLTIDKKGPGEVVAKDIKGSSEVEAINPKAYIATLADGKTTLKVELTVEKGVGYSPSEDRENSKVGVIILDALFTPVTKAIFKVEPTRFGKITNLDKLLLEVETDGSMDPLDAVKNSSKIVADYFEKFATWKSATTAENGDEENKPVGGVSATENVSVGDLPLQTRTINALKKHGVVTLEELAALTNSELEDIKNLGEKSISEIKKLLKKEGIR